MMMTFLKIAFYLVFSIGLFLTVLLFFAGLSDLINMASSNKKREGLIMFVSALLTMGLLGGSFWLGHVQQAWGWALGLSVSCYVAFPILFIGGMLMFGKIHWQ